MNLAPVTALLGKCLLSTLIWGITIFIFIAAIAFIIMIISSFL